MFMVLEKNEEAPIPIEREEHVHSGQIPLNLNNIIGDGKVMFNSYHDCNGKQN